MTAVFALDDYPRHAPTPRPLRRVNGCATVTALCTSMVHPAESQGRVARVQRIVEWLDSEAPKDIRVSSEKVSALDDYHWEQIAECMKEPPISKTTRRQVVSFLRERQARDLKGPGDAATG